MNIRQPWTLKRTSFINLLLVDILGTEFPKYPLLVHRIAKYDWVQRNSEQSPAVFLEAFACWTNFFVVRRKIMIGIQINDSSGWSKAVWLVNSQIFNWHPITGKKMTKAVWLSDLKWLKWQLLVRFSNVIWIQWGSDIPPFKIRKHLKSGLE